jgi:hypothetical protein
MQRETRLLIILNLAVLLLLLWNARYSYLLRYEAEDSVRTYLKLKYVEL